MPETPAADELAEIEDEKEDQVLEREPLEQELMQEGESGSANTSTTSKPTPNRNSAAPRWAQTSNREELEPGGNDGQSTDRRNQTRSPGAGG